MSDLCSTNRPCHYQDLTLPLLACPCDSSGQSQFLNDLKNHICWSKAFDYYFLTKFLLIKSPGSIDSVQSQTGRELEHRFVSLLNYCIRQCFEQSIIISLYQNQEKVLLALLERLPLNKSSLSYCSGQGLQWFLVIKYPSR